MKATLPLFSLFILVAAFILPANLQAQQDSLTKKIPSQVPAQTPIPPTVPAIPAVPNPAAPLNKIDHNGKKYTINGQKAGTHAVDKMLGSSRNPAVLTAYHTAKATKVIGKIVSITSYPSTAAGATASVVTFNTVYKEMKSGTATTSSYVNAGLSFLGTMALPITSKILKKKKAKLYDKVIDMYNVTN
jgi:hypothetical protein